MPIKLILLPFYPIKMHQPDCYCNWLWRMHCTGSNIKDSWLKALCTAPENFQRNAISHLQNVLLTKHIWLFNGARSFDGNTLPSWESLVRFPAALCWLTWTIWSRISVIIASLKNLFYQTSNIVCKCYSGLDNVDVEVEQCSVKLRSCF